VILKGLRGVTLVRFNFRTGGRGGSAVRLVNSDRIAIAVGDWVSVSFDGFVFEFDAEDFPVARPPTGPDEIMELKARCFDALRHRIAQDGMHLHSLIDGVIRAFNLGMSAGEAAKVAQIRFALGLMERQDV